MKVPALPPELHRLDLPREGAEPVFGAPWHAQAFALAVLLHRQGRFSWAEWVAAIGEEIARAPARPGERTGDAYYRQWLAALERLCTRHRLTDASELDARTEQWRLAYLGTPHGRPVRLENAAHAVRPRDEEAGPGGITRRRPARPVAAADRSRS